MKRLLLGVALSTLSVSLLAVEVGLSISVAEPGFYGRLDIGNVSQPPPVIYAHPVVAQPVQGAIALQPLYLHVPPGQAKNWRRYCRKYNACGHPVYFVQENWYNNVYLPHQKGVGKRHGHGRGKGRKD